MPNTGNSFSMMQQIVHNLIKPKTMKYLEIKSAGVIDIPAFSLIGACTKRDDDTKIGYYGSGLKYSIASLLRNNVVFHVFAGLKEIQITTTKTVFREQSFDTIVVDGKETSLTTSMGGKDWDDEFFPIREIFSNALDEDEKATLKEVYEMAPQKEYTTFYVQMIPGVKQFYDNTEDYFCSRNPNVIFSNDHISVYPAKGRTLRLYRRGIMCKEDSKTMALFSYNSSRFEINESRVLSSEWGASYEIAIGWGKCTNPEAISTLIYGLHGGNAGKYEHTIAWNYANFSPAWYDVLRGKKICTTEHRNLYTDEERAGNIELPYTIVARLKQHFPDLNVLGWLDNIKNEDMGREITPSETLANKVIDAVAMLRCTSYNERLNNPTIKFMVFINPKILGRALDGKIILSQKIDTLSIPEIAKIIIEENEHNITSYEDETLAFQNHLFALYLDELMRHKTESVKSNEKSFCS
jgi:hypothetical protein